MLTKFLITNNFPAQCFFTTRGALTNYSVKTRKLTLQYQQGGSSSHPLTQLPLKIIHVPRQLFYIHVEIYKKIFKQLQSKDILSLINEAKAGDTWEDELLQTVTGNLSNNLCFPIALQGIITSLSSLGGYDIPIGEGVFVESSDANNYQIRTVDGIKLRLRKKELDVGPASVTTAQITTWKKRLDEIVKEYEEFVKINQ